LVARFSEKVMETLEGHVEGVDVDDVEVLVEVVPVVVDTLEVVDDGGVVPEPLMAMSAQPR
jgi:hypothetical protein